MSSLAHLATGSYGLITALPRQCGLAKRLISLGLVPGARVVVLQNRCHGPLIVEVHGARIALGRRQAERVSVEPFTFTEPSDR